MTPLKDMKTQTKIVRGVELFKCGHCKHYKQFDTEFQRGTCYFNPPTVTPTGASLRPEVRAQTAACGQWSNS